jgi:hypothetical protein
VTATVSRCKKGQAPVATAGNELQMMQTVTAMQTFRHGDANKIPALEKRQGRGTPSAKS